MSGKNISAMPEGYFACHWCRGGVRFTLAADGERTWPTRCPHCSMHPHPNPVDETVGGKVDPTVAKTSARNRRSAQRVVPLSRVAQGQPVLGIDPGYRYTGIVARDGDVVLYAATLVRPKDLDDPFVWADRVADEARAVHYRACPPGTRVGIEGVSAPKGFKHGEKAPIDPKFIMFTAVVAGVVSREFKAESVIIAPGGNGSQHITHYPPELVGSRPKDLPGSTNQAGTRAHEQSAYDVAGKAAAIFYPAVPLDLFGRMSG